MDSINLNTILTQISQSLGLDGKIIWTSSTIITLFISVILLLATMYTLMPILKSAVSEHRLKKAVRKLGRESIRNVILPDGVGGNIFIDYLVLSTHNIIVVILKRYRGTIFCADNIELWTQLLGKRSFKFHNPLQQNDADIQSLRHLLPATSIEGIVLFHGECEFPKGKPERVRSVSEILLSDTEKNSAVQPDLLDSWQQLKETIVKYKPDDGFVTSYFRRKVDFQKIIMPGVFVFLLVGWLYLRIFF